MSPIWKERDCYLIASPLHSHPELSAHQFGSEKVLLLDHLYAERSRIVVTVLLSTLLRLLSLVVLVLSTIVIDVAKARWENIIVIFIGREFATADQTLAEPPF